MGNVDHALEKRAWEREAIRVFLTLYNQERPAQERYRLLYQQEKPDAVLEDAKRRKLGVEITHLFYDQTEAMQVFHKRGGPEVRGQESFDRLIDELNLLISRKEKKKSSYSLEYPIALLIRNASPGFGMKEFLARRNRVMIPEGVFLHIWYVSRDGGEDWKLEEL